MPSLNALRAFDAVAQTKSYKEAAENLRVTPAAVKQLVAKLEAHLGVTLIERDGQGLSLTSAGEAGAGRLSDGFAALQQAVGLMVPTTQTETRLVISAEPFFAQSWLVPRLQRFRDANPGIDVLIDSSLEIKDLSRDGIDGAVRYGVAVQDPERTTRLFGDAVMPLCSPQLLPPRPWRSSICADAADVLALGSSPGAVGEGNRTLVRFCVLLVKGWFGAV